MEEYRRKRRLNESLLPRFSSTNTSSVNSSTRQPLDELQNNNNNNTRTLKARNIITKGSGANTKSKTLSSGTPLVKRPTAKGNTLSTNSSSLNINANTACIEGTPSKRTNGVVLSTSKTPGKCPTTSSKTPRKNLHDGRSFADVRRSEQHAVEENERLSTLLQMREAATNKETENLQLRIQELQTELSLQESERETLIANQRDLESTKDKMNAEIIEIKAKAATESHAFQTRIRTLEKTLEANGIDTVILKAMETRDLRNAEQSERLIKLSESVRSAQGVAAEFLNEVKDFAIDVSNLSHPTLCAHSNETSE